MLAKEIETKIRKFIRLKILVNRPVVNFVISASPVSNFKALIVYGNIFSGYTSGIQSGNGKLVLSCKS